MSQQPAPRQGPIRRIAGDWHVIPGWLPVPDLGVLPVNAFLLAGPEPMLVDTGLAALSDAFVAALAARIDPADLRYIWLSHTDADHIGNLDRILDLAPNARVVTNFLGAGKMQLLGKGDPARLHLLQPGEVFEVGGHRLHQVRPPYYDAPETMGFFDPVDRAYFAADAFGALLPAEAASVDEIAAETLRDGLVGWSSVDAPWLAHMDQPTLGRMLSGLERLAPEHLLSGHLPDARGLAPLTSVIRHAYARGTTDAVPPETIRQIETLLTRS
ncbi:putative diflavin flavoprotein A 3 [Hartmannibacter diazotrophicus]|uniref:Putative diflavin flavoprotein A 3 n=1 Tax=Hartmannibacter diazotrophicus TaxID=1482074 RepID=A0A2C9D8U6_9HYPH|nr:MBL fold metallo-hydrolase [Hartmannibacter diazotrophicus]SON56727.1 putative diflavin flavoprotein A 3 [Hartmannibacter diazotrophicus]